MAGINQINRGVLKWDFFRRITIFNVLFPGYSYEFTKPFWNKIKKKPNKRCFIEDCKLNWIITKVVKKIEFVPDIEQLGWNSRYRKKVFNSKQFSYIK